MGEWTAVSRPLPKGDTAPPPWPSLGDPRTAECKHDWNYEWGQPGERQRRCRRCRRWIWERAWWPVFADTEETRREVNE